MNGIKQAFFILQFLVDLKRTRKKKQVISWAESGKDDQDGFDYKFTFYF
jgi:hypothetical protein